LGFNAPLEACKPPCHASTMACIRLSTMQVITTCPWPW
jgi:hypothetical protein